MTQHEYVFVAVSMILGLAITRLLHTGAMLIRAQSRVKFHWSTTIYAFSIMAYILQLWWVGWGLRELPVWEFSDFLILIFGSICIYGAAEMALPVPNEDELDMLQHSQHLGRLSALSMLMYFAIGPYVNLAMYHNPVLPAIILPLIGILLMVLMITVPRWFQRLSALFAVYSLLILYLTA
jgi:hypothetical protein